ncbi:MULTISPECIES: DUF2812 domain-containing protein [Bacillus]|jgi:hypothetical protein|uniref:Signal peptidase I n=1 Tax=Bacillus mycoides TaxID=1405 RepID=A0A0A0WLI6_BACMY|nr:MULTISPECIES: DUF2812 domain-containing protein [Bacillus]EEL05602.1 hypothetical protein bcere0014_28060 [Bacillus cereus BDRD-ST196]EJQ69956.1 hypothetical protein IG7_02831 [Bacillus cereus HuA2-4]EJS06256.1 hypothetical protein IKO_02384 [Bacillus cereus VDM034]EJS14496.1 hypothetical protein IKS_02730 [Bacillus cereus VDM062]KXY47288.1 signal peptidase I [Bacillus cereus]RAN90567.1 signal peptidase I [Bacillus sp. SRB_28]
METKKVLKFFAAWSLEKEEAFLRKMHQQGWALQKYNVMYTFKKTEPKDVIYKADFRLDYKDSKEKQKEYIELYEMCGWKHVTSFTKWNYFCKEVEEENELPDIYSEKETRIQKLKELSLFFVIMLATILPSMYNVFLSPIESRVPIWAKVMVGVVSCMWMYLFIRLSWKIKKLKSEIL